jgi:CRP/FNR family transcriptional regulator
MNVEAQLQLLRQIPYFRSLPLGEVSELTRTLRIRQCRKGDVIFRKGDPCQGLCIVLRGRVRTVTASADGRQQVLKVFGPGRTFGDIPVFDDEPLPADAVAITESLITVVPKEQLLGLFRRHPEAAIDVIRLFASRLRAYKQMVEDLSMRSVTARVARLLVDRATGVQTLVEESPSPYLDYTQDEIASMVGSVREVVQRALKTLEHVGLIDIHRGRIRIIDVGALSGWISEPAVTPSGAVAATPAQKR